MTSPDVVRNLKVHYLSLSTDWATPTWLYAELDQEFHFDFDPCPLRGADGGFDGLTIPWGQSNYVNPPYGREIGKWTRRARTEATDRGKTVVMLVPSRTDTRWWHEDIMTADEIRFVKGRLKFGDAVTPAPFPSAVVVWQ